MDKPRPVLDYFVRLIVSCELASKREFFHALYSGKLDLDPGRRIIREYDADNEVAAYEERDILGHLEGRYRANFRQEICDEVIEEARKVKALVFETLTSGEPATQEQFHRQVVERVDKLSRLVNQDSLFARYPCIAAALLDIKEFSLMHAPLRSGDELVCTPKSIDERVVGLHYKYFKEGSRAEDAAMTRSRLGDLFYKVRDELRLIDSETSLEDFRAIFSGKVVTKPIKWKGTNRELREFYKSIEDRLVPPAQQLAAGKWETVAACFIRSNGEPFTAKQLQSTGPVGKSKGRLEDIGELGRVLR